MIKRMDLNSVGEFFLGNWSGTNYFSTASAVLLPHFNKWKTEHSDLLTKICLWGIKIAVKANGNSSMSLLT
jgi:hypothetical protein